MNLPETLVVKVAQQQRHSPYNTDQQGASDIQLRAAIESIGHPELKIVRLESCLRALMIASTASVPILIAFFLFFQNGGRAGVGLLLLIPRVWALSLVAGLVFVFPVLAVVRRLRKPPLWLATIWGTFVGWSASSLLLGRMSQWSIRGVLGMGIAGAVCGLLYAVSVRRLDH